MDSEMTYYMERRWVHPVTRRHNGRRLSLFASRTQIVKLFYPQTLHRRNDETISPDRVVDVIHFHLPAQS